VRFSLCLLYYFNLYSDVVVLTKAPLTDSLDTFIYFLFYTYRCTSDLSPDAILLHYKSPRGSGYEPVVVGIVKEVAKVYFQIGVGLEQLSTQDKDNNVEYTIWRIRVTAQLSPAPLSNLCPMAHGELKPQAEQNNVFSGLSASFVDNLPLACPFSRDAQTQGQDAGTAVCPAAVASAPKPTLTASTSTSTLLSTNTEYGLTGDNLRVIYPYHIVVDKQMNILQCGNSLEKFLKHDLVGKSLLDFFEVSDACPNTCGSKNVWGTFVECHNMGPVVLLCKLPPIGVCPLSLQGPAVFSKDQDVVTILCVPNVVNLSEMTNQGLNMTDIQKQDFHLKLIFLAEHLSSEREVWNGLEAERWKKLADTAETSLATKKTFVRYVSHEIRTPLSISKLGLDLIADELRELNMPEPTLATIEDCRSSMAVAVDILNDLLNYEKLEGGIMDIYRTYVPVIDFINKTIRPFTLHAKQKGVDFQVLWDLDLLSLSKSGENPVTAAQLYLLVDEAKMSQVFRNLTSNALKFTNTGGRVVIECTVNNRTDDLVMGTGTGEGSSAEFISRARSNIAEQSDHQSRCVLM
jgi:hypothetical protein